MNRIKQFILQSIKLDNKKMIGLNYKNYDSTLRVKKNIIKLYKRLIFMFLDVICLI
jgi:hypothetical protein